MPPSPSLRRSPSKEISHRRGHSFGSTVPAKPKDDELTLFNDMRKNEEDNFLLESSDNFDETICNAHSIFPISIISLFFCYILFLWWNVLSNWYLLLMLVSASRVPAKLSYFPDLKLGVNIARREESRDFLNTDGDKNDYDWYAVCMLSITYCFLLFQLHSTCLFSYSTHSFEIDFNFSCLFRLFALVLFST